MANTAVTQLVFLDDAFPEGRLADSAVPQLFATDLGATRGDGVFESLLAIDGHARKVAAHLDRLASSARMMDLSMPDPERWRAAIGTGLEAWAAATTAESADLPTAVVKLLLTRGVEGSGKPTAWVQVSAVPAAGAIQREKGLDVLLLDRGYDSELAARAPWLLLGAKTLSYAVNMAALRYAHQQGADDVIFTSADGRVLEGPTSSVLIARVETRDGQPVKHLVTPQLDAGILPGTTQGALFAAAQQQGWVLGYGPLVPQDLFQADALWLVSSIRGLAPIRTLDGREVATHAALTAELNSLFDAIN
ncbi:aminodeoxychorismate lyase [Psychromicrobium xiongbiense]|uniref:aminodeoxychorismate lyase n=1 Tax=Psychromicrobium xiongbiense TaxID=3051184 RepID=UPI002557BDA7|nr:aminodeoxychorismate lyase [Psychromicrobium sp. YIM S02556]